MSPQIPRLSHMHFWIPQAPSRLRMTVSGHSAGLSLPPFFGRSDSHLFWAYHRRRRLESEGCALELPVMRQVFA